MSLDTAYRNLLALQVYRNVFIKEERLRGTVLQFLQLRAPLMQVQLERFPLQVDGFPFIRAAIVTISWASSAV